MAGGLEDRRVWGPISSETIKGWDEENDDFTVKFDICPLARYFGHGYFIPVTGNIEVYTCLDLYIDFVPVKIRVK